jgi:hypothetical protein
VYGVVLDVFLSDDLCDERLVHVGLRAATFLIAFARTQMALQITQVKIALVTKKDPVKACVSFLVNDCLLIRDAKVIAPMEFFCLFRFCTAKVKK